MHREKIQRVALFAALILFVSGTLPALAQEIDRDKYLTFMPLHYPRLVRQTIANAELDLYGDRRSPDYRDQSPVDGMDDERARTLHAISVRFAPYLVQNTTNLPMDFKRFWDQGTSFPLYVDAWNLATAPKELMRTDSIDFNQIADNPCSVPDGNGPEDDCKLVKLLQEFDPDHPTNERMTRGAVEVDVDPFKVMFFDFPGEDPASWKAEFEDFYSGYLPRRYQDFLKIYAHPFIERIESNVDGLIGYRLIFQYWFFYPTNDGGNNHEGDWEHVNVVISPRSSVTEALSAEGIQAILSTPADQIDSLADPLVIKEAQMYFHSKVFTLDYSRPNAYAPRADWEAEIRSLPEERRSEKYFWKAARQLAYLNDAETILNTHPVGYIGADNKGLDQLLSPPGGTNRDSHGTYPFPGMYKAIGPAGATEQIAARWFEPREWYAAGAVRNRKFGHGEVVFYDEPELVDLVPDWERVIDLVKTDARARRDWAWLVLPLRWGYPAVESPFAGVVSHAETGNLAVVGPAFNAGWNRGGASAGFAAYTPHKIASLFPLGWQDNFINSWGYLNLTFPTLVTLPPFDFAWRILSAPIRYPLGRQDPVYYPADEMPSRLLGLGGVYSIQSLPDGMSGLFLNENQLIEILQHIQELDPDDETSQVDLPVVPIVETATGPALEFGFFLGGRFATENLIRHTRSTLGLDIPVVTRLDQPVAVRGDLNMWEYAGSLRYNLSTGAFMTYLKAGWGISWYRIENATIDGQPMKNPNGPWVRKPNTIKSLLPNTWHVGAGFEANLIRSYAKPLKGTDLSLRADYALYSHNLGLKDSAGELAPEIAFLLLDGERIYRSQFNFMLVLGF